MADMQSKIAARNGKRLRNGGWDGMGRRQIPLSLSLLFGLYADSDSPDGFRNPN
jgi:hypothetical protein